MYHRRKQVREVSGNRKKRKLKDETVGEAYFMAFGFLCLQALALQEKYGVRGQNISLFSALFSIFNWELMKLLTHIKNELNTVVLTHTHEYSTGLAGQIHSPLCSLTWRSPVTAVCRAPPHELSRVIFRRVLYLCVCACT